MYVIVVRSEYNRPRLYNQWLYDTHADADIDACNAVDAGEMMEGETIAIHSISEQED